MAIRRHQDVAEEIHARLRQRRLEHIGGAQVAVQRGNRDAHAQPDRRAGIFLVPLRDRGAHEFYGLGVVVELLENEIDELYAVTGSLGDRRLIEKVVREDLHTHLLTQLHLTRDTQTAGLGALVGAPLDWRWINQIQMRCHASLLPHCGAPRGDWQKSTILTRNVPSPQVGGR